MKKHLLAAAVAGAFALPAAAQVTVYGVIDIGYANHIQENAARTNTLKSSGVNPGNHAGSRLGFRGEEDLGGGLRASFVYEMGVAPNKADGFNVRASGTHPGGAARATTIATSGAGTAGYTYATNRQSWLGLSGGFGVVRAGYQYTTGYNMVSLSGLAASEMPGHRQNAALLGSRSESIQYTAPKLGAMTFTVQVGQGDTSAENEATTASTVSYRDSRSLNSVNLTYASGPLYAGIDLAQQEVQGTVVTGGATAATNNDKIKTSATHIGLSYDFGVAKVAYVWGDRGARGSQAASAPVTSTTAKIDTTTNALTLFVPMSSALVPFVQWGTTEIKQAGAGISDITGQVFGARYNLSKRTLAYVMHGTYKDDLVTTTTAHKETRSVVGVSHSF